MFLFDYRSHQQLLEEEKATLKEKFNPLFHRHLMDAELTSDALTFIMEHDVMDRTDFYAYEHDRFGSTKPEVFNERQSPKELFDMQALSGFNRFNEQMFRTGIRLESVKAIACHPDVRRKTMAFLQKNGVTEVNGKPLEEFLVAVKKRSDFLDVAMGRKPKDVPEMSAKPKDDASEPSAGFLKQWLNKVFR